jgi:hypothetical protein
MFMTVDGLQLGQWRIHTDMFAGYGGWNGI